MTYAEAIYICSDLAKSLTSDDSVIQEDHIRFLLNKYRAALLKKEYKDIKKKVSQANYQTICLDLEVADAIDGEPCTGGTYLRSVQEIPTTLDVGSPLVYPIDYFQGNITYISRERMRYVGHNKYLKNIIYVSLGPDQHLYFTSNNPQYKYLKKVKFDGVFEDAEEANNLACTTSDSSCDPMEQSFPIEDALFPSLQELVIKDLVGVNYRPQDSYNNASDDLGDLTRFLSLNSKSNLQKQLDGTA